MVRPPVPILVSLLLMTVGLGVAEAARPDCERSTGGRSGDHALEVRSTHAGLAVNLVLCIADENGRALRVAYGSLEGAPGSVATFGDFKPGSYQGIVKLQTADGYAAGRTVQNVELPSCAGTLIIETTSIYTPQNFAVTGPTVRCEI